MSKPDSAAAVVVLGSANIDLVYSVVAIPSPGETVLATGQARHAGGKGLNQAVAAARAGATTAFVCSVGEDLAGSELVAAMREADIETALVRKVDVPTGTALITVQEDGDNAIVVAAGANGTLVELDGAQREAVAAARVLVAQQEIPAEVVAEAAVLARSAGTTMVLNAAPAREVDAALLDLVDVLVVNEHEALALVGGSDPLDAARQLSHRLPTVVVTLGPDGCAVMEGGLPSDVIPAVPAVVVDTTGAGDTFTGVLVAGLAEGLAVADAARRAVVAAAISVERPGAVPSIPTRAEIDARCGR